MFKKTTPRWYAMKIGSVSAKSTRRSPRRTNVKILPARGFHDALRDVLGLAERWRNVVRGQRRQRPERIRKLQKQHLPRHGSSSYGAFGPDLPSSWSKSINDGD